MSLHRAHQGFQNEFLSKPQAHYSAPGRVNLIGEHTDYNDGYVLPFAVPQRTSVSVALRPDQLLRVHSVELGETVEHALEDLAPDAVSGWSAYPLGVAWALRESKPQHARFQGVDIAIASDVPLGAGLSSSAALESAVAEALNDLWELGLDRVSLALAGQRAENTAVGAQTGIMDQMASMMGEEGNAVFLDCRSLAHELIPCDVDAAGMSIVVIDSNTRHSHAGGEYGQRRASCEKAAAAASVMALRDLGVDDLERVQSLVDKETFRRARHIVTENDRVLATVAALRQGDLARVGSLLVESHESMRDDFDISTEVLDEHVQVALESGALGARMTGGGFGGSVIALVDTDKVESLGSASQKRASERGMPEPTISIVVPSGGARKDSSS